MRSGMAFLFMLTLFTSCMDHYELGEKYFEEENYEKAEFHFEKASKIDRGNWKILYNLARSKEEVGKYDQAIDLYSQSLTINKTVAGHLGRARCYQQDDYYLEGAIIDYSEAIRLRRKGNFDAFYGRGRVYMKDGNYYKALADINQAIKIRPEHINAYYHRAIIRSQIRDNRGALSDMNYVIRKREDFRQAHFNRGIIYQRLGAFAKAVNDFNVAIRLGTRHGDIYVRRGKSFLELGNTMKACKDFKVAEKLSSRLQGKLLKKYCS
ncbi:MAG: tetratricopeptide repeat protein [Bacteroidota bacterium]